MAENPAQSTVLLDAASRGQAGAVEKLLPLAFDELRKLARVRMAHVPPGNTLQPTALVHEAYLKLVDQLAVPLTGDHAPGLDNRKHFFGAAARAMRDILVDQARRKGAIKAGGDRRRDGIDHAAEVVAAPPTPVFSVPEGLDGALLALDEALKRMEEHDPRKAEVVMLKYFAGLEHEQIARALNVSVPTVERDWRFARSWLQKEIAASKK